MEENEYDKKIELVPYEINSRIGKIAKKSGSLSKVSQAGHLSSGD